MQIEAEFKKRSRSGNDFILERGKIYKLIEEVDSKFSKLQTSHESFAESLGIIFESSLIQLHLSKSDLNDRRYCIFLYRLRHKYSEIALYGSLSLHQGQQ